MAAEASVGLQLKTRTIHRISGPVSVHYLKPSGPYPLILLFGDVHRSEEGMCDKCTCTSNSQGSQGSQCCSLLHDAAFLQGLDEIASEYPVDFFTETDKTHPLISEPDDGPLDIFINRTHSCYDVLKRSAPNYSQCPTSSIRWHYNDIRMMTNKVEPYLISAYKRSLDRFLRGLPENGCDSWELKNYLMEMADEYEGALEEFAENLSPKNSKKRNIYQALGEKTIRQLLDEIVDISTTATSANNSTANSVTAKLLTILFSAMESQRGTRGSGFFKELDGLPQPLQDTSIWLELITLSLQSNTFYQEAIKRLTALHSRPDEDRVSVVQDLLYYLIRTGSDDEMLPDDYDIMTEDPYRATMISYTKVVSILLLTIEGILLDVYTIARMLKRPVGGAPSALSVGYMGNAHVVSIIKMLAHPVFGYQVAYETHQGRCQTIRNRIPLYTDLQEHIRNRYRSENVNLYRTTLEREKRGRATRSKNTNQKQNMNNRRNANRLRNTKKRPSPAASASYLPFQPSYPVTKKAAPMPSAMFARPSAMFARPAPKPAPKKG